ncbi:MAG: hypothetical protein AB7S81_05985 [Bdellovibrionales bacterium]
MVSRVLTSREMRAHEQMMQQEMDIGVVNAAQGIVFERLFAVMQEYGKDAPETLPLKEDFRKYTELLRGVQCGEEKAIQEARTSVREFVDENGVAFVYEGGETKIIPRRELLHGQSKPDQLRPK